MRPLDLCRKISHQLAVRDVRVVFAESCTAGLVSATLARIPGISAHLCGSAVTYRNQTKQDWLGVPPPVLLDPGPVSAMVAREMAEKVLERTPEADVALSVTGHLGPDAPAALDGLVFVGSARRGARRQVLAGQVMEHRLGSRGRSVRQREAVQHVLMRLRQLLKET